MQNSLQINSQMQKVILLLLLITFITACSHKEAPLTGRVVEEIYKNSAKEILEKPDRIYQKTIYSVIEKEPVNYNYFILRDLNSAKGINTVFISLPYKYNDDKFVLSAGENYPLEEDFSTKYFLDSLNFLKKKGFSVGITINFEDKLAQKDIEQVTAIINKWSKLAEKNKAEYFEPFSTNVEGFYDNKIFSTEIIDKSILEARKNFNGKMISKTDKTSYIISETSPEQGETVGSFKNRLIDEYKIKYSRICQEDKKVLQEVDPTFTFNLEYYKAYKQASKELSKCFGGFRINSYERLDKKEVLQLLIY